jgi:FkbM family methyltransferase
MRSLSPIDSLTVFKNCLKESIDSVVDVGVQAKTDFLIEAFPDAYHYLFEPVSTYQEMIQANYERSGLKFKIEACAVSDRSGMMFQHLLSSDGSGKVTHSQLLDTESPETFRDDLIDIQKTPVITLDDWGQDKDLGKNYMIKIDVDGIEEKIISGGERLISGAKLVMIEAPLQKLSCRLQLIEKLGFQLFDIVGNGYYFDQLQQVDLIFISQTLISSDVDFQPWEKTNHIIWEKWVQIS